MNLPNDFESVVEPESVVAGNDWNVLRQSLRNDLSVEGIGVMWRQVEEFERVIEGKWQDSHSQVGEAGRDIRFTKRELADAVLDRKLRKRKGADFAHISAVCQHDVDFAGKFFR